MYSAALWYQRIAWALEFGCAIACTTLRDLPCSSTPDDDAWRKKQLKFRPLVRSEVAALAGDLYYVPFVNITILIRIARSTLIPLVPHFFNE